MLTEETSSRDLYTSLKGRSTPLRLQRKSTRVGNLPWANSTKQVAGLMEVEHNAFTSYLPTVVVCVGLDCKRTYCKAPCKRPPPPPPPFKHKFLRKVGGGRLLGILPFVQSIIQPLKVRVNTKRLAIKQISYLFQF